MVEYTVPQQIFCLSYLSNINSLYTRETGSQEKIQEVTTEYIEAVLSDSEVQQLIGEWEVVWGPVVYQYDGETLDSKVSDNTMYIVKSKDNAESDHYVIAIAGTNPISWYGWIIEDLWVHETKPWNNGQPWKVNVDDPSPIRVSAGTSRGLQILCEDMQSDNKLLLDYLKYLTSSASKPISITVTGHSLGGTLSAPLALSLMDRRSEWDSQSNVPLSVLPLAGLTPGNAEFALYYDNNLGEVTDRVWNELDFFPHIWQQHQPDLLEQTRTLYEPYIQPTGLINLLVDFCKYLSKDWNYQQICQNQDGFNIGYNKEAENALIDPSIDAFSKLLAKLIVNALDLPKLLIDTVAEIISSLIKDLIQNIKSGKTISGQKINEIDIEPYIEKIIAKIQLEKSDLNTNELKNNLSGILSWSNVLDFVKYMSQVFYQHISAYNEHFKVSEFLECIKRITDTKQK
ncbi:MAG: lipase family protein [Okeania sp. SIO2D1]|nr:lipase family protein [Okeania sp. SIO2D1]